MESIQELEELLEAQFGPFIRDSRYTAAFKTAMRSMRSVPEPTSRIDVFYLFLHHLILELFSEIDRLSAQLQANKNS